MTEDKAGELGKEESCKQCKDNVMCKQRSDMKWLTFFKYSWLLCGELIGGKHRRGSNIDTLYHEPIAVAYSICLIMEKKTNHAKTKLKILH